MARELRDRYASMADVVSDLDRAAKGQAPLGPHRQQFRLPRLAAMLAGTLVVVALAGVAVHHFSRLMQNPPRPEVAGHLGGAGSPSTLPATGGLQEPHLSGVLAQTGEPAATDPTYFVYTTNNGAITITKYTGTGGAVTIPSEINGLPVVSIGSQAFRVCTELVGVTIPYGVTNIGYRAFWGCARLTDLTIPSTTICLDGCSFENLHGLLSIRVDPANPAFGSSAEGVLFSKDKTRLVYYPGGKAGSYMIPNGVTNIGKCAFVDCSGLTSVTIPNSVTSLGAYAFFACSSLIDITIPPGITSIEDGTFYGCTKLTRVNFPDRLTSMAPVPSKGAQD